MAVYVDNFRSSYGRMKMVHMMADTSKELLRMAKKIGVQARWLQRAGTSREHFDICLSKRKIAVAQGAIEVGPKEIVALMKKKEK